MLTPIFFSSSQICSLSIFISNWNCFYCFCISSCWTSMESLCALWVWAILLVRLCRRSVFHSSNWDFSFPYRTNKLSALRLPVFSFLLWHVSTLVFNFLLPFPLTNCKIGLWLSFYSSSSHIIYFVCWVLSLSLVSYRSTLSFALPAIKCRDFRTYPTRCFSNFHTAILLSKR